jgi:hypothetical protein
MKEEGITSLLQEFKMELTNLMGLKPRVEILFISAEQNSESDIFPLPQIYVWHPFIFDNRLVPNEFNGVPVSNVTISSTLPV